MESYRGYDQIPIAGTSLAYTIDGPAEKTRKGPQYFEMFGHRGIWDGGWKAVTYHQPGKPFSDEEWELYHLDSDFSECRNLAAEKPEKLREMIDLWWVEAGLRGVLAPGRPGDRAFPHQPIASRFAPCPRSLYLLSSCLPYSLLGGTGLWNAGLADDRPGGTSDRL